MTNKNPPCPNCKTNVNVVKMNSGYRCSYCEKRFYKYEKGGQQTL